MPHSAQHTPDAQPPAMPQPGEIWPAPAAPMTADTTAGVAARVMVPGSKSLTNRHLIIAALSQTPSVVSGVLESRDTNLMMAALEALGASFEPVGPAEDPTSHIRVTPLPRGAELDGPVSIDTGLAGTVMRFIPPVAGLVSATVHCDGDPEARVRPMAGLLDGVAQAGVEFAGETPQSLPFTVHGHGTVPGGRVQIDSSASSQFISGLLLAASAFENGIDLVHAGPEGTASPTPSPEHVAMTVQVLRQAGVEVDDSETNRWIIKPTEYSVPDVTVEPDLSNAGPFLAAALVTGGTVEIPHWPKSTTQIGDRWRDILPRFGATVEFLDTANGPSHSGTLRVTGQRDAAGRPVITGGGDIPDTAELAPTVASLAVLATEGTTTLSGIGHLRGHETDRLHALAVETAKVGGEVEEGDDYLTFSPAELSGEGVILDSWADHRMATFAAILGLALPGIQIRDVATTSKTMPRFPIAWTQLVATIGSGTELRTIIG